MLQVGGREFLISWGVLTICLGVVFIVFRRFVARVMERNPMTPSAWRRPIPPLLLLAVGVFLTLLGVLVLVAGLLGRQP